MAHYIIRSELLKHKFVNINNLGAGKGGANY